MNRGGDAVLLAQANDFAAQPRQFQTAATFKVVPVDDEVDERAGVTIDFTSFTITQSHFGDAYWDYTVPYQVEEPLQQPARHSRRLAGLEHERESADRC